jgi:hypothetical protein
MLTWPKPTDPAQQLILEASPARDTASGGGGTEEEVFFFLSQEVDTATEIELHVASRLWRPAPPSLTATPLILSHRAYWPVQRQDPRPGQAPWRRRISATVAAVTAKSASPWPINTNPSSARNPNVLFHLWISLNPSLSLAITEAAADQSPASRRVRPYQAPTSISEAPQGFSDDPSRRNWSGELPINAIEPFPFIGVRRNFFDFIQLWQRLSPPSLLLVSGWVYASPDYPIAPFRPL